MPAVEETARQSEQHRGKDIHRDTAPSQHSKHNATPAKEARKRTQAFHAGDKSSHHERRPELVEGLLLEIAILDRRGDRRGDHRGDRRGDPRGDRRGDPRGDRRGDPRASHQTHPQKRQQDSSSGRGKDIDNDTVHTMPQGAIQGEKHVYGCNEKIQDAVVSIQPFDPDHSRFQHIDDRYEDPVSNKNVVERD